MKVFFILFLVVLLSTGFCHVTFCLFDASAVMQSGNAFTNLEQAMLIPFWWTSWTYSVESLVVGFLVYLFMHYRMMHDDKFFSYEKLGLVLGMVHKTQTPLILMQNLLEDVTTSELPESTLKKIKRALGHINHLMDCYNIVTSFYRLDKKINIEVHSVECELYSYITSITDQCRIYADLRQIRLNVTKHFEYVHCQIDDTMMAAAIQYFLWKVIDVTPCKNKIDIDIMHSEGYWSLQMMNYQVDEKGGKRIMLSISGFILVCFCKNLRFTRKIVRQHGGRVTVKSWGRKVEFQIIIPLNCDCDPMESLLTKKIKLGNNMEVSVSEEKNATNSSTDPIKEYHVLLVMSDKKLSGYLNEALSTLFYVTILEQPENIFCLIGQKRPDAIILDEVISGVYGKDLCLKIKSVMGVTNIPIILLINSHDSYLIHFRCGADRLEFRRVNISRLKVDILSLINIYANQRRLIDNLLVNHFLANQPEILDKSNEGALFMEEVQKHLEKNLSTEGYTIDMLSADMAMSRTRFYTKIKEITGKSPAECINSFKMYRAKILLITEQYSITEIANLLGYCDAKYFGKVFKKFYHVSPSEYVKSMMNK